MTANALFSRNFTGNKGFFLILERFCQESLLDGKWWIENLVFDVSASTLDCNPMFRHALTLACLLAFSGNSFGAIIFNTAPYAKVDGKAISAQATLDIDGNFLVIRLQNLATTGNNTHRLTNFEFDIEKASSATLGLGVNNAEGSVNVASGSSIVGGTNPNGGSSTNISGGWVFGKGVSPYTGNTPWSIVYDYGVSATSFRDEAAQVARFDGSQNYGNTHAFGKVNGGDWGLLGNPNNFTNIEGHSVVDTVLIRLKIAGTLDLAHIKNAAFTYGSEQEGVGGITGGFRPGDEPVPEPASLAIWGLGMGLAIVAARFRRKLAA